jgi:inorganic pyrophosphatase
MDNIPTFTDSGLVHVIIDTPQGSRNKYKYDAQLHIFKISRVLPIGMCFPHDFGSIPGTVGADGDPLDALVLVETPSFVGCLMQVRLIGVIEAEQVENRKILRNDRLIAVAETPVNKPALSSLNEVSEALISELEHFFVNYNRAHGREFRPKARRGPAAAQRLLKAGIKTHRQHEGSP